MTDFRIVPGGLFDHIGRRSGFFAEYAILGYRWKFISRLFDTHQQALQWIDRRTS